MDQPRPGAHFQEDGLDAQLDSLAEAGATHVFSRYHRRWRDGIGAPGHGGVTEGSGLVSGGR
ncbi:hypothetical protein [Streptomyces sp. Inha503]|uniref:hypothetical protein n=1 Tax=Streptomyces sp. Inha503 TaxID=3383314 RepID=UPI0039A0FF5C